MIRSDMVLQQDNLPVIAQGASLGEWKNSGTGSSTWVGEMAWLTCHGKASLKFVLGKPFAVYDVALPDGSRAPYCEVDLSSAGLWRIRAEPGPGYRVGTVEIGETEITFTPVPQPLAKIDLPSGNRADLAFCLSTDAECRRQVGDLAVAHALYHYLCNRSFRRDLSESDRWSLSWRSIGQLVASMRDIGENYTDFYLADGDFAAEHTVIVEEMLERLGWHAMTPEDFAADHVKALAILQMVEARPANSVAPSARAMVYRFARSEDQPHGADPASRMHRACAEGRASQAESDHFFDLADLLNERAGADLGSLL